MNYREDKLLASAAAAQTRPMPKHAKDLIYDLAQALKAAAQHEESVTERAAQEVDALREQLSGTGPADADTYMDLPHTLVGDVSYETSDQRALGKGVNIEFRPPGTGEGEGINVKLQDGELHVHGLNALAVVPVNGQYLKVVTR